MALDVTHCRSEREKLQWAFRLYDVDDSGSINLKEITAIMETLDQVIFHKSGRFAENIVMSSNLLQHWKSVCMVCRVCSPTMLRSRDQSFSLAALSMPAVMLVCVDIPPTLRVDFLRINYVFFLINQLLFSHSDDHQSGQTKEEGRLVSCPVHLKSRILNPRQELAKTYAIWNMDCTVCT